MAAGVVALIWLGMLLGVSFLATPVKFAVQDLSLPVALQIGQATFRMFNHAEWLLSAALAAAALVRARSHPLVFALALALGAAVLCQSFWLLPALDARIAIILAGETPPASTHHALYTGIEVVKAVMLALVAVLALRNKSASQHARV